MDAPALQDALKQRGSLGALNSQSMGFGVANSQKTQIISSLWFSVEIDLTLGLENSGLFAQSFRLFANRFTQEWFQ
jgi:hypothetical protein